MYLSVSAAVVYERFKITYPQGRRRRGPFTQRIKGHHNKCGTHPSSFPPPKETLCQIHVLYNEKIFRHENLLGIRLEPDVCDNKNREICYCQMALYNLIWCNTIRPVYEFSRLEGLRFSVCGVCLYKILSFHAIWNSIQVFSQTIFI